MEAIRGDGASGERTSQDVIPYRKDIDGLRAIAVSSVIMFHAGLPGLKAGFMGVDIFFVISGFLIGGIIYRQILNGQYSFLEFYSRRAKRIIPSLLLVVLSTILFGLLVLTPLELTRTIKEGLSAIGGVSNIWYWRDTDYFKTDSSLKPLLMTWSLGVEEQFYIVFPFVILAVARFRRRYHIAALTMCCTLSFVTSIYLTYRSPTDAFYLLPPRAWELGTGAVLAMARISRPSLATGRLARSSVLAIAGLLLLALALFTDIGWPFPGFVALLPVIGTAILLHTSGSRANQLIGNKVMVAIGLVSYSWYLWHWPMMALLRIVADRPPSYLMMTGVAALALAAASLSLLVIERPLRRRSIVSAPRNLWRYGLVMTVAGVSLVALSKVDGSFDRVSDRVLAFDRTKQEVQDQIHHCLAGAGEEEPPPSCAPDTAEIALFGDSHAAALATGLEKSAREHGQHVARLTKAACTPVTKYVMESDGDPGFPVSCLRFNMKSAAWIVHNPRVKTVILAAAWPSMVDTRYKSHVGIEVGDRVEIDESLESAIFEMADNFRRAGKRVVVVGDVPRWNLNVLHALATQEMPVRKNLNSMIGTGVEVVGGRISKTHLNENYDETDTFVRNAAINSGSDYLSVRNQMCSDLSCSISDQGKSLFIDDNHLSYAGSMSVDWGVIWK